MSSYDLLITEIGRVKVTKKRGQSSLRIRLSPKGEVLVSAPYMLPKIAIEKYILSKKEWINDNLPKYDFEIFNGIKFGKNLTLEINENQAKNYSKLQGNVLKISVKGEYSRYNTSQQQFIEKRMVSALKDEAEMILLPKLQESAHLTGHTFNQAFVKNLKSRWGSCDRDKNIILNIFLLQIPEELQNYVIIHELTHTIHLNHSSAFWKHVEEYSPDYKKLRKQLKQHQPRLEERE